MPPGMTISVEQQVNSLGALQQLDRPLAVARHQSSVTEALHNLDGHVADVGVVLDHEDRTVPFLSVHPGRVGPIRLRKRRSARKIKGNAGPGAGLAFDVDPAARLLGEAVYHRKAETRSFADFLCGKKRFECACHDLRGHACPLSSIVRAR
jgi:hypothetical protein